MTLTTHQIGRPIGPFPIIDSFLAYAIERQTMTSPRPTRLTEELKLAAAAELADDLVKGGQIEERQRQGAIADLARHADSRMDGYELAKVLDDRCCWSCDFEMAEALDVFSDIARKHLTTAQRAWFEAEHPEPPAAVGQRVAFTWGRAPHTGIITADWEHGVAQFAIKVDGDPDGDGTSQARAIVNWEVCKPLTASPSPNPSSLSALAQ